MKELIAQIEKLREQKKRISGRKHRSAADRLLADEAIKMIDTTIKDLERLIKRSAKGALHGVKVVIYDCDGVLFDSKEANSAFYNEILSRFGLPPLTDHDLELVHAGTVHQSLNHLFRSRPELLQKAIDFAKNLNYTRFVHLMKREPYIDETLRRLREKGIKTALATNRSTTLKGLLEGAGLKELFDLVVSSLDVAKPKPHPEPLLRVLTHFDTDGKEAIYVGDTETDRQAAESAGIIFVSYKNPRLKAAFHISNHRQILNLLGIQPRRPQQSGRFQRL